MAVIVIHKFKVVQVTENKGVDPAPVAVQYLLPLLFKVGGIVQAGELVMLGYVPETQYLHICVRLVHNYAEHAVLLMSLAYGHGPGIAHPVRIGKSVLQLHNPVQTAKYVLPYIVVQAAVGPHAVRPNIQQLQDGRAQFDP